jgi:filamin
MDCTEVEEGYKVRYTPLATGEYFVVIKYNGHHIVGSPFKVRCFAARDSVAQIKSQQTMSSSTSSVSSMESNQQTVRRQSQQQTIQASEVRRNSSGTNASKVVTSGAGTQRAQLGSNTIIVNCDNAGNSKIFASLFGPLGPCDDISIKHAGGMSFAVTYVVRDRGEYTLTIKWGDEHIPGSPFKIQAS